MAKNKTDFEKVIEEAKRWGVKVIVDEHNPIGTTDWVRYNAPFAIKTIGCNLTKRQIYVSSKKIEDVTGSSVLHELAHIVVGKLEDVDEVDSGMLAFEYYTAKKLRLQHWEKSMMFYAIGKMGEYEWGDASAQLKEKTIQESIRGAIKNRMLTKDLKPNYRRI